MCSHIVLTRDFAVDFSAMRGAMRKWATYDNLVPGGKGRGGKDVSEATIKKVVSMDVSDPVTWTETRLQLWYLTEVEVRFWQSMKETSPTLYRVAILVFSELSSSSFAERVFSTSKLILKENRGTLSFDAFKDLVILRHNTDYHDAPDQQEAELLRCQAEMAMLYSAGVMDNIQDDEREQGTM